MRTHLTVPNKTARGFSALELLVVGAMFTIIVGFIVMHFVRGNRTNSRSSSSMELANYLQRARLDSMKRNPTSVDQMAQVKVFNGKYYSVALDANNDGYLDIPLVMKLPAEKSLQMQGPFPKEFIFDGSGQNVDSAKRRVPPSPIILGDESGATAVKFSETGDVQVVPSVKLTAAK